MGTGMSRWAFAVVVLAFMRICAAGEHAPWPADWNNWDDPTLWATVGNADNEGELSGGGAGGLGPDRVCGAVDYEYRIGKYEVTAGQYCEFLNKVAGVDTCGLYSPSMSSALEGACMIERYAGNGTPEDPYQYRVASDFANRPVNCVSWGDAARFANWLHNGQRTGAQDLSTTEDGAYCLNGAVTNADLLAISREPDWKWAIPTEDEWYKAAYHMGWHDYWDYPTRTNELPRRSMDEAATPGNNANFYPRWYESPYPIDPPYYTTVVGEFEFSESPYGTFDQGGNVWEWNEAIEGGSHRGLRGGSFGGYDVVDLGAAARSYHTPADDGCTTIAFRVVQVPEPTTLGLLAVGWLALLPRGRRGPRGCPGTGAMVPRGRARKAVSPGRMSAAVVAGAAMLLAAGAARAEFTLRSDEQLEVNGFHQYGELWDQSRARVLGGEVNYLNAYDTSAVDILGGTVNNLYAHQSSGVGMSCGTVNNLNAYDTSTVDISGGIVYYYLYANDSSTVRISADAWVYNELQAWDTSTVDISGGQVVYLYARRSSTVDLSGGRVDHFSARESSSVSVTSAGRIYHDLSAHETSSVRISAGGWVDYLSVFDTGVVDICSGGQVNNLLAHDTSTVTLTAPSLTLGSGVSLDGDRVLGTGLLSGEWLDGTPWWVNIVVNASGATIQVVPEPATLSLLAFGGAGLLRRRRRAR